MIKNCFIALLFAYGYLFTSVVYSGSIGDEIQRVASETTALELGFGGYHLGKTLTAEQKEKAQINPIAKTLKGTYKFKDGKVFVITNQENDMILGVYKEYPDISMEKVKGIVGGLMFEFGEPTIMVHSKLIYWSYNKNGKISQDEYDFARQSGGAKSLATVKFSSSELIGVDDSSKKDGEEEPAEEKTTSAYTIITSDPLSKLFMAYTEQFGTAKQQ